MGSAKCDEHIVFTTSSLISQAFTELRMKQIELQKQLVQVSSQQSIKERQKRKGELTGAELAELPADTKLYRSVGKTCVLIFPVSAPPSWLATRSAAHGAF